MHRSSSPLSNPLSPPAASTRTESGVLMRAGIEHLHLRRTLINGLCDARYSPAACLLAAAQSARLQPHLPAPRADGVGSGAGVALVQCTNLARIFWCRRVAGALVSISLLAFLHVLASLQSVHFCLRRTRNAMMSSETLRCLDVALAWGATGQWQGALCAPVAMHHRSQRMATTPRGFTGAETFDTGVETWETHAQMS